MPYLLTSEVFPTRIRSHCVSFMMALHWAMNFGNSRATPSLLVAGKRYGAFIFFAAICIISIVFAYFCMPETAGSSPFSLSFLAASSTLADNPSSTFSFRSISRRHGQAFRRPSPPNPRARLPDGRRPQARNAVICDRGVDGQGGRRGQAYRQARRARLNVWFRGGVGVITVWRRRHVVQGVLGFERR